MNEKDDLERECEIIHKDAVEKDFERKFEFHRDAVEEEAGK